MPDGTKLGKAKLRGVESDGMILSEAELEIGEDAAGIARARRATARPGPGRRSREVLPIAEPVLELEVDSNRVDCLGVYGVAREVHAITGAPLGARAVGRGRRGRRARATSPTTPRSRVEVPDLCPRFTARVFTGRRRSAPRRCG